MKISKNLLGARIKEIRKNKGLSQEQLAENVGIDPKHLSRIEVGKNYPSINTLEKIADSLDIEIKELFEFMHHMSSKELIESLNKLTKETNEDNLRLIFKLVSAIVR